MSLAPVGFVFFARDCGPEIAENALKNPLSFTLDRSKQWM